MVFWLTGLVLGWLAAGVWADERILAYHSDIKIGLDADITVTETIRVRAEGRNIRRGIYRDFPTRYTDSAGSGYSVGFEVLAVARDGYSESWHTARESNGVRIYLGDADQLLAAGEYEYVLTYRTDRQIGYFENHDELYWNVTGNGWAFPIERASGRVQLPVGVPAAELTLEAYTGSFGATGRDFHSEIEVGGAQVSTTRTLGPGEGLTLVLGWPKGIVYEPDRWARFRYFMADNGGLLLALLTLLLVGAYLSVAWHRYGRDPQPGTVFPHYEPPPGYSPGAVRYISRMGYDSKALAAAVISLAVKGYLKLSREADTYLLTQTTSNAPLGPGETVLLRELFGAGPVVELTDGNHELIGGARKAHRQELRRHYYRTYFLNNTQWLVPSFLGSVLALFAVIGMGAFNLVVLALFALNLTLQGAALFLMKAPTRRGRALMDGLDGFELYLSVAEQDDLDRMHPPELTPELFERYLPFAIALGVENQWADKFAAVLSRLGIAERTAYQPAWYQGDFFPHQLGRFVDDVGAGFSSAIASAATPPGSSSGGGGGGFSGGGGGGGGGGGW
jgi:uncharacterized membrane protein YgcG